VIGIDDAPHIKKDLNKNRDPSTPMREIPIIGVVCRGLQLIHVSQSKIHVDGKDSTKVIIDLFLKNPYKNEIRLIMIDSPTLGGFNPVNPFEINSQTEIPVILIPDSSPKEPMFKIYEKIFPDRREEIKWLKNLPPIEKIKLNVNANPSIQREIFFHAIGINREEIIELLQNLCHYSATPEPLRLAHLIASKSNYDYEK
jgi:uncharacterized protein